MSCTDSDWVRPRVVEFRPRLVSTMDGGVHPVQWQRQHEIGPSVSSSSGREKPEGLLSRSHSLSHVADISNLPVMGQSCEKIDSRNKSIIISKI